MIGQKKIAFFLKHFPALTSGVLLSLSFPEAGLSYLAFIALVPLFISLASLSSRDAFYAGFTTGFFYFSTLVYWIVPTVNVYGGLNMGLAVSTLILFCFYLALYPAVFAFLLKKSDPKPWVAPLFAAALWVGLEYIRTYAFTGFSWGAPGYSQYNILPLIQIADFSGVYGVSGLIILVNYVLALVWISFKKKQPQTIILPALYTLFLLAGTLFYGNHKLHLLESMIKSAQQTTLTVVQGNIKQDFKWSDAFKERTVQKYIHLSQAAVKKTDIKKTDLLIWPETALPFYYGFDRPLSNQVDQCIRALKTNFLIGSPAFSSDKDTVRYYNRVYLLNPLSIVTGTYDKTHLVPFGEYVPLGDYLTFLGKLTAQAGNFSMGDKTFAPLTFNDHKTGVLICFEILFPSIASGFVKNGADILITITNDAWFGKTSAALQHFSIAVFRAVESRRAIARAANTGISGFIDPRGKILDTTALFTDQTLTRRLPALKQISWYTRYGDVFAICCLVAICMVFMIKGVRKKFGKTFEETSK